MKKVIILSLVFISSFFATADDISGDEAIIDATIAMARARIGEESALRSVKSVYLKGSLMYGDGTFGSVEIIFKKPSFQKFDATVGGYHDVSALNKSEGWRRVAPVLNPDDWSMEISEPAQVFELQASVSQALNFFARPTKRNASVAYSGRIDVKGTDCVVLTYDYGDGIWFRLYFDAQNGTLVQTIDHKNVTHVEQGEIIVNGIRFAKKRTTYYESPQGVQSIEVSYNKIDVNREIDDSVFKVPALAE